jgi:hypothetical protein
MSTTIPTEFTGTATLTPEKLETIKEWYRSNLGDADKADTVMDELEYSVAAAVAEGILRLLHDMPLEDETPNEREMIDRLDASNRLRRDVPRATESYLTVYPGKEKS